MTMTQDQLNVATAAALKYLMDHPTAGATGGTPGPTGAPRGTGTHQVKVTPVHPKFNWSAADKLAELEAFWLEVENLFSSTYQSVDTTQCAHLILQWMGCEGVQWLNSLEADKKTEALASENGLKDKLKTTWQPFSCITVSTLQFIRMQRKTDEDADAWLGCLRIKAAECRFGDELNHRLMEHFIYGINDKEMMDEISKELAAQDEDNYTLAKALKCAARVQQRRAQLDILGGQQKSFDDVGRS